MDNEQNNKPDTRSQLEKALEGEIERVKSEGFEDSAKCLTMALKLLKQGERAEYDQWRKEQGIDQWN